MLRGAAATPQLSVVIGSHNATPALVRCLRALLRQRGAPLSEIIVADSSDDGRARAVESEFPQVRWLHFAEPLTIPELRGKAIAQARAAIVAVLDPYSLAQEDWAEQTVGAHAQRPNLVIGGAVELHDEAPSGLLGWALYFNEYGMFMPPVSEGAAAIVAGSNVSYKRAALFDGQNARQAVFWKTFVNQTAQQGGSPLWLAPAMRVSLYKPVPFADYALTRFHHGRCFGAMRMQGRPWWQRLGLAAAAPLVPWVLCGRWSRVIWRKRRRRVIYLATLPLQLALFSIWATGEFCGYLFGPGKACRKLFY